MQETYFNHIVLIEEASHLSSNTFTSVESLTLTVPNKLEEIVRHEAFYCRASEEEMPSRMVLHGSAVTSLIAKGVYIDLQHDPEPSPDRPGYQATTHIPLNFPGLNETDKINGVVNSIKAYSDAELEVQLNPLAHALLGGRCEENGLSNEVNFIALAALINYIGVSEREGLHLSIYTDGDPRLNPETEVL